MWVSRSGADRSHRCARRSHRLIGIELAAGHLLAPGIELAWGYAERLRELTHRRPRRASQVDRRALLSAPPQRLLPRASGHRSTIFGRRGAAELGDQIAPCMFQCRGAKAPCS